MGVDSTPVGEFENVFGRKDSDDGERKSDFEEPSEGKDSVEPSAGKDSDKEGRKRDSKALYGVWWFSGFENSAEIS